MSQIGFTGTRKGWNVAQSDTLAGRLFSRYDEKITIAHHGMCIGADVQFHNLIRAFYPQASIIGHPPVDKSKADMDLDVEALWRPRPYLERNQDIVDQADKMYATPAEMIMMVRSGTWATVRYALRTKTPINVILPDGSVKDNKDFV